MTDPRCMRFELRCVPPKATAQGSARIFRRKDGTQFVGKDRRATTTRADLMALLAAHAPREPYRGPLRLTVRWVYPWRDSESRKRRELGLKPCDTRPDADNICKLLLDCMTRLGFWTDDAQIYSLHFVKVWDSRPGIWIELQECGETTRRKQDDAT